MNEFTLYTFTGDALIDIVPDESSTHEWSLMSENRLSLTFELDHCVNLSPGCYIDFDGVRYYLLEEYKPQMIDTTAWKYDVDFRDAASWMSVTLALKLLDGKNTPIFNYTAPALEHAQIIVDNLNRSMGTTAWKVGSVISTANIKIEYRAKYCSDVLQEIVDGQNTEWWLDGMTLNIGRAEFGDAVELGYGNGLLGDIVCEQADNLRTYAYLCPIGSTRNIDPTKYGYERLQLPNGQTLVPMNTEQGFGELAEEKAFSKIFPRYEGTVKSVRSRPAKGDDGREFTIYYIGVALPFNPNDYEIAGLVKQITFLSEPLMGQDFEVNYDEEAQEFEIITRWPDGGDAQLPGGLLTPEVGDKYVIWNITMPDVYYTLAAQEFLEAAEAFAAEAIQDVSIYKAPLDYIEVQERGLHLRPGQRVRLLSDAYFASGYYDSRITRITRNIMTPDELRVDISAVRATGTLSRLQATIQKTENQVAQISGALPTVIKSGEDTAASDSSVYTSAKSEREFLNRRKGGPVLAPVDFIAVPHFPAGADFNGAIVKFDAERKCWIFPHNLLVEGEVVWNSTPEGFDVPTFMDAVRVDNITIKKDNGVLTVIGGAGGSGGGVADSVLWSGIIGKPTTIGGYGITDAYTKSEVVSKFLSINGKAADSALLNGQGLVDANGRNGIPVVSSDGYTDMGKAIDFHHDTSGVDYSVRLLSQGNNKNKVYLPTATGILALTDDIANALLTYVTLATNQDIAGIKNFINGFKIGGKSVTYNAEKNALVFPLNAIFEGEVAWNSTPEGFKVPTIMDAIQVDGDTISKEGNVLKFVGKIDNGFNESQLAQYLTNNGYATQTWVTGRGYITGITASMVTSALGYTPYNSANFTKAVIKATLGISGWALESVKPTYTASEVGALPKSGGTIDGLLEVASTIKGNSVITATHKMRVNAGDSPVNFGYLRAETFSSNRGLVHIGSNYGGSSTVTNDAVDVDAIGIHRGVVGVGRTYTGDELKAAYDNNIKLLVEGNMRATGEIAWNSSRVLKNIINDEPTYLSMEDMLKIKPYRYTWKDGRDDKVHAGGIADEVLEVLPEVIITDSEGIHAMDYGQASFTVATSLTPHVNRHEEEIDALKRRVKALEDLVTKLLNKYGDL